MNAEDFDRIRQIVREEILNAIIDAKDIKGEAFEKGVQDGYNTGYAEGWKDATVQACHEIKKYQP